MFRISDFFPARVPIFSEKGEKKGKWMEEKWKMDGGKMENGWRKKGKWMEEKWKMDGGKKDGMSKDFN